MLIALSGKSTRAAIAPPRDRNGSDPEAFSSASLSKSIPILTTQQNYIDPWVGFQLPSYSLLQSLPETIETAWPAPLCPPLFERCRSAQGSGLLGKRFRVVLQVEDLLLPLEAFMLRHAFSFMPNLHVGGLRFHLHFAPTGRGVE
jgi:hypothetical protein